MSQQITAKSLAQVLAAAGPYPLAAYRFVQEGLRYTVEQVHDQPDSEGGASRHVTGQQLCMGLRDFAIEQYGVLAPAVLASWHVHRTEDFGRMVFALVELGELSKTPRDSMDDFRGAYDFAEAFSLENLLGVLGTGSC